MVRALALVLLAACNPVVAPTDAGDDAGSDAGASCEDRACDNGDFCDGVERCEGECVSGASPCLAGQRCDEASDRCLTACDVEADADGDGHDASECGGDDCDDADATRAPGLSEACNARDDDCDGALGAIEDADRDGHASLACGGDDCDDARADVAPGVDDACDGVDADCDGEAEDADADGFVAAGASCVGGLPATDCDDSNAAVSPVGVETCDGGDQDCDLTVDETVVCTLPNSSAECTSGACEIMTCDAGWDDCDGAASNGCEADLTSPSYCEGCAGDRCELACIAGACDPVVQIAAGNTYTYALRASGRVSRWGAPSAGEVRELAGITDGVSIANGYQHACILRATGEIACVGSNVDGQLGDGTTMGDGGTLTRQTPVAVLGVTTAVEVACGEAHTCARLRDGTVWCWGANADGQLGRGTTSARELAPAAVVGIGDAIAVAATRGAGSSCAVRMDGTVWCWGDEYRGILGDGSGRNQSSPVRVAGLTGAIDVTIAEAHACALRADRSVACWGANSGGTLGDGTEIDRPTYVDVTGLSDAIALDLNFQHSCALRADRTAVCWGINGMSAALGTGTTTFSYLTPTPVAALSDLAELTVGRGYGCARNPEGIWCWGENRMNQLGTGTGADPQLLPALVVP